MRPRGGAEFVAPVESVVGREAALERIASFLENGAPELALESPVLLAIDDLQWLDRPSAAALRFASRRLREEPVRLVASVRLQADAPPLPFERDLAGRLLRVAVGPLSVGALHRIVVSQL